jgi:hypothetical protein
VWPVLDPNLVGSLGLERCVLLPGRATIRKLVAWKISSVKVKRIQPPFPDLSFTDRLGASLRVARG